MKVRLYDAGKKYENYPDRYSLYFPYPKWMQREIYEAHKHHVMGFALGCTQDSDGGVIRCDSFDDDRTLGYHVRNLGRKIPLEKMSHAFQRWARSMERKWNDALKFNDDKHWDAWVRA